MIRARNLLQASFAPPLRSSIVARAVSGTTAQKWDYDVVVVGGGVVGAALACELARMPSVVGSGVSPSGSTPRILVVESFAPPSLKAALDPLTPVDVRTYAMTPASEELLERVGAWSPVEAAGRTSPYEAMQVWSTHHAKQFLKFDAFNHGGTTSRREKKKAAAAGGVGSPQHRLGTIVEHTTIQASLFEEMRRLHDAGLIDLRCPAKVKKFDFDASAAAGGASPARAVRLELEEEEQERVPSPRNSNLVAQKNGNGEEEEQTTTPSAAPRSTTTRSTVVTARLVVAADGANSPTRQAAGLGSWGWEYGQRAVVATVDVGPDGLRFLSHADTDADAADDDGKNTAVVVEPVTEASTTTRAAAGSEERGGGGRLKLHAAALQRFLPSGPLALLPLWDKAAEAGEAGAGAGKDQNQKSMLASVIWSTTALHAQDLCALDEEQFVGALNEALGTTASAKAATTTTTTGEGVAGVAGVAGVGVGGSSSSNGKERDSGVVDVGASGNTAQASPVQPTSELLPFLPELPFGFDPLAVLRSRFAAAATTTKTKPSPLSSAFKEVRAAAAKAAALTGETQTAFAQPPTVRGLASKRFALPLSLKQAHAYCGWRVALVGDAAHTVHPMAGQGLNLGLGDAQALAQAIDKAAKAGLDFGDPQVLAAYETDRRRHNTAMALSFDTLHRLFRDETDETTNAASGEAGSNQDSAVLGTAGGPRVTVSALPWLLRKAVVFAREGGIGAINALPPLKQALARVAMGK